MDNKQLFKRYSLLNQSSSNSTAGQSLVEFALLLPVLALLLAGVFDLGRAFHALIAINNAGREAARYGTLHRSDLTGMRNAAIQEAQNSGIVIASDSIALTCPDAGTAAPCARDTSMMVQITYQYNPILGFFFPAGVPIRSTVEMRIP
ncbi:MAG TPA: TadE/TadG family type IV pilus assembly protein [Anaerolineales bacterium]|nr:TadE/TadG family type IV pilus assembly protein [Anaerolineales bacterium]